MTQFTECVYLGHLLWFKNKKCDKFSYKTSANNFAFRSSSFSPKIPPSKTSTPILCNGDEVKTKEKKVDTDK